MARRLGGIPGSGPSASGCRADDAGFQGDAHHRRAWELILADDALRAEYEDLKAAGMDGAQKAAFFERVVAMLGDEGGTARC